METVIKAATFGQGVACCYGNGQLTDSSQLGVVTLEKNMASGIFFFFYLQKNSGL